MTIIRWMCDVKMKDIMFGDWNMGVMYQDGMVKF